MPELPSQPCPLHLLSGGESGKWLRVSGGKWTEGSEMVLGGRSWPEGKEPHHREPVMYRQPFSCAQGWTL